MEVTTRKTVWEELSKFDALSNDTIEVTEWLNGEGWDISIGDTHLSLTRGTLAAINYLVNTLDYNK